MGEVAVLGPQWIRFQQATLRSIREVRAKVAVPRPLRSGLLGLARIEVLAEFSARAGVPVPGRGPGVASRRSGQSAEAARVLVLQAGTVPARPPEAPRVAAALGPLSPLGSPAVQRWILPAVGPAAEVPVPAHDAGPAAPAAARAASTSPPTTANTRSAPRRLQPR